MGKTRRKRRPSSEQEQTKGQVPQRGLKEAHVLAVVYKRRNKGEKETYFQKTKTNRGESAAAKCKEAFVLYNPTNPTTKNNPHSFLEVTLS